MFSRFPTGKRWAPLARILFSRRRRLTRMARAPAPMTRRSTATTQWFAVYCTAERSGCVGSLFPNRIRIVAEAGALCGQEDQRDRNDLRRGVRHSHVSASRQPARRLIQQENREDTG